METVGAIFGGLGFLALAIGLLMFLPIAPFRTARAIARWLVIGGFASFVIGLIITPSPPEPTDVKKTVTVSAATAKIAPPTPIEISKPGPHAKDLALKFANEIVAARVLCDIEFATIDMNMRRRNSVDTYASAGHAIEYCKGAASTIAEMKVPADIGEVATTKFESSIDACRQADDARAEVAMHLQKVVDESRISEQAALKEAGETAVQQAKSCVDGVVDAAISAGATEKEAHKAITLPGSH